MCSVVGYIGSDLCRSFVLEGLARLEYRGYDSAGFACLHPENNQILYVRSSGQLSYLVDALDRTPINGHAGIGHTRWSTHGAPSEQNAHPQFDCHKRISIVHNGIIENYRAVHQQLVDEGHTFHSQTDTETIAHLFESALDMHKTLLDAVIDLVARLSGAYAFIALLQDYPDTMVVVRKGSPVCIGIGENQTVVASDLLAFAGVTNNVIFLPESSFALVGKDSIGLFTFAGDPLPVRVQEMAVEWKQHGKNGFEHFMLKEIYEQKQAISATINFLQSLGNQIWDQVGVTSEEIVGLDGMSVIGSGSSWHAAAIGKFFFEKVALMPTQVSLSSEFRYASFFPQSQTVYLCVSQSGETADTLEAMRMINSLACKTVALTNVSSSTMVREAGGFLLTHAGHEVAVASTKAFSTQLVGLYWFASRLALEKGIISSRDMQQAVEHLLVATEVMENLVETYKRDIIQNIAPKYAQYDKFIFLGRDITYPCAQEAALKLREIAYKFVECYPAGELKHGPIALIAPDVPVFIFSSADGLIYQKLVSSAQEVRARNGHIVSFVFEGQQELIDLSDQVFIVPLVPSLLGPLAMIGLIQFLMYQIARVMGCPIDKPRNLAKSVTVE